MTFEYGMGLFMRSILQAVLVLYLLTLMGFIHADGLWYLVASVVLFSARLILTKKFLIKDMQDFSQNLENYKAQHISKEVFIKNYIPLDLENDIYMKRKNLALYLFSYTETLGHAVLSEGQTVTLTTSTYYYL